MEELRTEEIVGTVTPVFEDVVETVVDNGTNANVGNKAGWIGLCLLIGAGIVAGTKFIKDKKAKKDAEKAVQNGDETEDSEEQSDK